MTAGLGIPAADIGPLLGGAAAETAGVGAARAGGAPAEEAGGPPILEAVEFGAPAAGRVTLPTEAIPLLHGINKDLYV